MSIKESTIAFSTLPVNHQVRLEDRISFAYLEYAKVIQTETGIVALKDGEEGYEKIKVQIPASSLAVVILGPGTSITAPALTSCARAGASVLVTGSNGISSYALATPLTSSAKWAIAQAKLVSNESEQIKAAVYLYKKQMSIDILPGGSINTLRGLEGRFIRDAYKKLAKKHKIKNFKRIVANYDHVNIGLNLANSILYGCAASACSVLGINPALGIIHRGNNKSLLFDLADLYKPSISLPIVFSTAEEFSDIEPDDREYISVLRRRMRKAIYREKMLVGMLTVLQEILTPFLPNRTDDRLIADIGEMEKEGHVSYGKED